MDVTAEEFFEFYTLRYQNIRDILDDQPELVSHAARRIYELVFVWLSVVDKPIALARSTSGCLSTRGCAKR
eukprot:SAG11_NODE_1642_length_4529_cov_2.274944_6_plen_71_part_00